MIEIKDVKFNVIIEQKRIKNVYLRVDGLDIKVTAPKYMPKYEIYNFIESKKNWIYKVYEFSANKALNTVKYLGGEYFYIFNQKHNLKLIIGKKSVNIIGDTIYLSYPENSQKAIDYLYKVLNFKLLTKANEFLDKYLYVLQDYGYNLRPDLAAKPLKSKWGVCYTRNNSINISSYLIHYEQICLEYIIIHELTHFVVPNHSKRFYEIIEANMPDYKVANNLLKL